MKKIISIVLILCIIFSMMSILNLTVYAAPSTPVLTSPVNGQILPWHNVILRWNQVSGEEYFLLDMRNITTGVSVYENLRIAKDSTSVTIPKSKLVNGNQYRWFLRAVDANGNKTNAEIRVFRTEYGKNSQGDDSHFWGMTYASASHIDYFIHAPESEIDGVLEEAINSWNNISSNVYLHRDYANTTKELGVYENFNAPNTSILGRTYPGGSLNFNINNDDPYAQEIVTYTEILIYVNSIESSSITNLYHKVMLHETGHALGLAHTDGSDAGKTPLAPSGNRIDIIDSDIPGVTSFPIFYLVMNNGSSISNVITDVDKAHLKLKWGN